MSQFFMNVKDNVFEESENCDLKTISKMIGKNYRINARVKIENLDIVGVAFEQGESKYKRKFTLLQAKNKGTLYVSDLTKEEAKEISKGQVPAIWINRIRKIDNVKEKEMVEENTKIEEVAVVEDEKEVVEASSVKGVAGELPAASEEKAEGGGPVSGSLVSGITKLDEFSAVVAIDKDGKKLIVLAIYSYSKNQRYYLIYEKDADGSELGALNYAAKIEASKFEKKSKVVIDYIKNMSGNYNGQLGDIQLRLQQIEKHRILKHSPELDVEASTSFEEFYEKLKLFIERNVLIDPRIAVFEVKNTTHIAIIRTMEKSLMQVFREICREVDETVNPNIIKGKLYSYGLLNHDNNDKCRDCQLTISAAIRETIGSRGDKVISIKFDDDFVEKIKFIYSIGCIEYEEDEDYGE